MQERRVLEALRGSDIKCVALLDDAFDPPKVPQEQMGALLDLLLGLPGGELIPGVQLTREEIDAAADALSTSEYGSEALLHAIAKLFAAFVSSGDSKFDPGEAFVTAKGNNLNYVVPILELLRKCEPKLEIVLCGSEPTEMDDAAKRAQLIFVDYFLNAYLSPDGEPNTEQRESARAASLARLREFISAHAGAPADVPAIILMSSHDVGDQVDFRKDISAEKGGVFASRFDFLQKKQVTADKGHIQIEDTAMESLLGIVQSFAFGRAVYMALHQWKVGADEAIKGVWRDINDLKLKDFAYLTRFRLAQEGMGLSEYLEWFFSECLNDAIAKQVQWEHPAFAEIDKADGSVTKVWGAFDGATSHVAVMYDRVRVEKPRSKPRRNHRMGDLYLTEPKDGVRRVHAIITPDCDLLIRASGKPKAPRLLTVSGVLTDIDARDASLSDFLMIGESPQSIRWDLRDVQTFDFKDFPEPGASGGGRTFAGTLRPLYAYELRARVLENLGRIGLNVPPAVGTSAAAIAVVAGIEKDYEIPLAPQGRAACSLVLSRGGTDSTRAIFYVSAVTRLVKELQTLGSDILEEDDHRKALRKLLVDNSAQDKLIQKLSGSGLALNKDCVAGIQVTDKRIGRGAKGRHWCQIVLSNEFTTAAANAVAEDAPL